MFQLVENALADGDADYYRFFQECKKCKNLGGRKQIQGLRNLWIFKVYEGLKKMRSVTSVCSGVTSLQYLQLVSLVIIIPLLLFALYTSLTSQGLREEMTIRQWHLAAGSAYKSPPPYNQNPLCGFNHFCRISIAKYISNRETLFQLNWYCVSLLK